MKELSELGEQSRKSTNDGEGAGDRHAGGTSNKGFIGFRRQTFSPETGEAKTASVWRIWFSTEKKHLPSHTVTDTGLAGRLRGTRGCRALRLLSSRCFQKSTETDDSCPDRDIISCPL
ncbi:hypothetical protein J6590_074556 [Homalodisca vitripennis]|nr:hypothetical protein J6590_074556 [Homalodisca vitripennis]